MTTLRYHKKLEDDINALWYKINKILAEENKPPISKTKASWIYSKLKQEPHTIVLNFSNKKKNNELKDIFAVAMYPEIKDKKKRRANVDIFNSTIRV
jgi:hypothetical protein